MESTRKHPSYMHPLYWLLIGAAIWLSGCAGARPGGNAPDVACEAGEICTLEGKLSAGHPWEAELVKGGGCVALAVPETFASIGPLFRGKKVRVVGKAFLQPVSTPEAEMYYYQVRGMRVNVNACKLALVVYSISTATGDEWINTEQAPPKS